MVGQPATHLLRAPQRHETITERMDSGEAWPDKRHVPRIPAGPELAPGS